jgi:hypothetical protein
VAHLERVVVHEDVQSAELLQRRRDNAAAMLRFADVTFDENRAVPGLLEAS